MKIGLMSDSHDHMENVRRAVAEFDGRGVEAVLHAGDIVSPPVVKLFDGCAFQLHGVFGNNDGEQLGLGRFFDAVGGELHGDFADIELSGRRLGVYHGTNPKLLAAIVASGLYDVVITGHTHELVDRREGATRVLNPGSAHGFAGEATVMVLDTSTDEVEVIALDG